MSRLRRHTVARLRAPLVANGYGTDARDWTAATSLPIRRVLVLPASTADADASNAPREAAVQQWTLRGPRLADIEKGDRIVWRGDTYDVVGFPAQWETGRRLDHLEVTLQRVKG